MRIVEGLGVTLLLAALGFCAACRNEQTQSLTAYAGAGGDAAAG